MGEHARELGDMSSNRQLARGTDGYKPVLVPKALQTLFGGVQMSDSNQEISKLAPSSPISNKIGSVFIPVKDIEKSRDWYCAVLGLEPANCPIRSGHLCPLPMEGTGIILDTMPMWGGKDEGGPPNIKTPAFMFLTSDLQASFEYMKQIQVELVTEIEHNHWFVIKDPDENLLMVCRE